MKKVILSKIAFVAVLAIVGLTACEKETDNVSVKLSKATISGKVQVDSDLTNTSLENVPATTKLYAQIDTKDLVVNPSSTVTYPKKQYTTTVAADGTYSFTDIEVNPSVGKINVTIMGDDYKADYKDGTNPVSTKVFKLTNVTVTVTADVIRLNDLLYKVN